MSLNILRKQVKYCLLNVNDDEMKILKKKTQRKKVFSKRDKEKVVEENLKHFEINDKYKAVSKKVLKAIKHK